MPDTAPFGHSLLHLPSVESRWDKEDHEAKASRFPQHSCITNATMHRNGFSRVATKSHAAETTFHSPEMNTEMACCRSGCANAE